MRVIIAVLFVLSTSLVLAQEGRNYRRTGSGNIQKFECPPSWMPLLRMYRPSGIFRNDPVCALRSLMPACTDNGRCGRRNRICCPMATLGSIRNCFGDLVPNSLCVPDNVYEFIPMATRLLAGGHRYS